MKKVIVVQARRGSSRLPGKVLMDVGGRPMLAQQIRRLKHCRLVDEIVVATTRNTADDPIVSLANSEGVRWFRGDEDDVLNRYLGAASESKAEIIVRVTADCPLIDGRETDRVVQTLIDKSTECDYVSNIIERTFPRGLDAEAFFFDTLERLDRLAISRPAREHVTHFLLNERRDLFQVQSVTDASDNSDLRWTVDVPEDLAMVRRLYEELHLSEAPVEYKQILHYVRGHPAVAAMNSFVRQKVV